MMCVIPTVPPRIGTSRLPYGTIIHWGGGLYIIRPRRAGGTLNGGPGPSKGQDSAGVSEMVRTMAESLD